MRLTTQTFLGLCALYVVMLGTFALGRSVPLAALAGLLVLVPLGFALRSAGGRSGRELLAAQAVGTQARRSLSSLSLVLDVGVILLNPRHEIDFSNALACDLLGAGDEAGLKRRWKELRLRFEPALAAAADRDFPVGFELAAEEGLHASISAQVYRLNEDDCDAFLVLLRDRAVLDALRGDLILASQLKGLSLLYRAIAHDVRGPLHSMALNLELLKVVMEDGDETDEAKSEQAETLTALQGELTRINRALQAMLNETTAAAADAERFDARELVAEIERLLRPQARLQGVEVKAELPAEPVELAGQRDRLKQAVLNVAINALEAMPEGGSLDLRLSAGAGSGRTELAVRDTGPGMPPAIRRRVFELHFTTKAAGTGIGLFVARSIVESHGGEILAESTVGSGSTFRLLLPLAPSGE